MLRLFTSKLFRSIVIVCRELYCQQYQTEQHMIVLLLQLPINNNCLLNIITINNIKATLHHFIKQTIYKHSILLPLIITNAI